MQAVSFVVYWLVVPLIFLRLLSFANEIKDLEKKEKEKWSAREESAKVGFWAGILIAVVCISWQMKESHDSFNPPIFNLANVVTGIVISWIIIGLVWLVNSKAAVIKISFLNLIQVAKFGILALFLSAISVLGLFSYIFIDSYRNLIFNITLGSAIGILLFLVFFPETLKNQKKPQ